MTKNLHLRAVRYRSVAIILFLTMALAASSCGGRGGAEEGGSAAPPPATDGSAAAVPQVLIIAVDGMEPSLVKQMMERGQLPNLQRLVKRGSLLAMDAVVGTTSPVVWTTVATGTAPVEHGITDFTVDGQPVTSTLRRRPAFWNIFSERGLDIATVGWMVTWPAEDDAGIIVSDRTHWGRFPDKVSPSRVIDVDDYADWSDRPDPRQIAARFTSYPFNPDYESLPRDAPGYAVNFLLENRLINIFHRDRAYAEIAGDLMRNRELDVVAVYFQGIDYVSHGFWQWFEPEPFRRAGWDVSEEDATRLGDVIPRYYRYIDMLVGRLQEETESRTLTLLLSDHGFGTGLGQFAVGGGDFLSGNHRNEAVLLLAGGEVKPGVEQLEALTHFDVFPTLLWYLGLPQARDLRGRPLLRYFKAPAVAEREVRILDSYRRDGTGTESGQTASEHDEEILNELRSLGYIQ